MENCGDIRFKDDDVSSFLEQALVILSPDGIGIVERVLRAQVVTGFSGSVFHVVSSRARSQAGHIPYVLEKDGPSSIHTSAVPPSASPQQTSEGSEMARTDLAVLMPCTSLTPITVM